MSAVPLLAAAMAALLSYPSPSSRSRPPRESDEQVLWLVAAVLAFLVR